MNQKTDSGEHIGNIKPKFSQKHKKKRKRESSNPLKTLEKFGRGGVI